MNLTPSSCRFFSFSSALLAAFVLSGCEMGTIASRTKEKAAAFDAATPAQKQTMQDGWIDAGFTDDMVYIALGKPDTVQHTGDVDIWIYRNFNSAPESASLGKAKTTLSSMSGKEGMTAGQPTSRGGGVEGSARPDVGSADPAQEIPNLYVYFYKGKTTTVKVKRG